jgi:alkanesulfonate monooxygenase SsuD/methylene tetrahydromethanopterin reductase-like flavin-dependent oxidoreductase (luciferase family)
MAEVIIGVHLQGQSLPETVALIEHADRAGVAAAWLISGGFSPDSLTTLAVAGAQTRRIQLGAAIVVTFSRHPITMIGQAIAISQVAPGRLRLGIGPSHRHTVEDAYGLPFDRPLEHVREYATILHQAFHGGQVDFKGKRFRVRLQVASPPAVHVYLSALRPASYALAGEVADGAISWVTPSAFLREVAKPALLAGAAKRGNGGTPRLIGHAMGLVSEDEGAVRQVGRQRLARYIAPGRGKFYQEMFAAAGHPEAREGVLNDDVLDDLVMTGNEDKVARGIYRFLDGGVDELIFSVLPTGAGADANIDRTLRLLGSLAF